MYSGDIDRVVVDLEKLENEKGIQIIMADKNFQNIYNPRGNFRRMPSVRDLPEIRIPERQIVDNLTKFTDHPVLEKRQDKRLNSWFLSLYGTKHLNGSTVYILINTSVAAISDSALIANNFFMATGLITLLFGGIIILFISRKFSEPILEINQIAKDMSSLNFSRKIKADEPTGNLDQKTGADVIQTLLDLNNEGKTVVLITHDLNVASKAKRIVHVEDGLVLS